MRIRVLLALSLLAGLLTGCASSRHRAMPSPATSQLKPYLLFDHVPGKTFATAIPARAEWPTALAGRAGRERIHFSEWSLDRQGRGRNEGNDFYRRFTTRRSGWIER